MAEQTYLRNAPILEAVIDLQVKFPESFSQSQIRSAAERLKGEYPRLEERRSIEAKMTIQKGRGSFSPPQTSKFAGLFLKSQDSKQVAQLRMDGFAFSRLKPYTNWEEVSREAWRLWKIYVDECSPLSVTRIAIRTINHCCPVKNQ
jgi:uncharacterized protein (TIGR04255 family)